MFTHFFTLNMVDVVTHKCSFTKRALSFKLKIKKLFFKIII